MTYATDTTIAAAHTRELSPGVFAYLQPDGGWFINNTGFVLGPDHVVTIDSAATEDRTRAFRTAISKVTALPVKILVNTHWHTDHTNGNSQFAGALVVAHELAREPMRELVPTRPDPDGPFPHVQWGDLRPSVPDVTITESMTLWAGSARIEVRAVGQPAHTVGDLVVWLPDHGILYAGDLAFNGSAPLMSAGSITGSLIVLDELRALGPETVVPGHGLLCGTEVFDIEIAYLEYVVELARTSRARGLSPLDAALAAGDHPFAYLSDGERLVANLHRAYAELDGAAPGEPIDLIATRHDMMALNGGRPLTCHA